MDLHALIVEDSPVMRQFISRTIRVSGLGFTECWEAGGGEEGLEILRTRAVHLVVCDINMPGLNGEELLRRMQADEKLRGIPVVAVSADATIPRMEKVLELGAGAYVPKPFSPETLASEIRRVLRQAA